MILGVSTKSANSVGGNTTFTLAGRFLESGLTDYGTAAREVEITACFRGGDVPNSSLQASFDKFHSVHLPSLPTVKFLRKKARLTLEYETGVADATFLRRYGFLSVDVFSRTVQEVVEKLHLVDSLLKKSDDFDLKQFHQDIARQVASVPQSDDELRTINSKLETEWKQRLAQMDPWERLGIDWDDWHPAARELLNDPFFWYQAEDYSPHGNDTGADLLADFKKWNGRYPQAPAHEMVRTLLRRWDIAPIDVGVVDEDAVKALLQTDPVALAVTDEAMIAVAFAAVKVRGHCDRRTTELALKAIERERSAALVARWKGVSDRIAKLDLMADTLRRMPEAQS